MILKELINKLDPVEIKGNIEIDIRGVTYDSRKALPDYLFVCIDGFSTDGHKYAQQAVDNGAVALVVEKDISVIGEVVFIKVKNSREALAAISAQWFGNPSNSLNLIGITGTKGKTTTTYMIRSIFEKAGKTVGLIGTVANCIGNEKIPARRTTPESYDLQEMLEKMKDRGADTVVMEVSSQGLKLHRVSFTRFKTGVFTNFSKDHIGGFEHPDMEDYFSSKMKIFALCEQGAVNLDSPYASKIMEGETCPIITYGIGNKDAKVRADNIITHSDSVEFDVVSPWFNETFKVSVPGLFSVYNALAAITVSGMSGIDSETIKEGLSNVNVPGRAEVVPTPGKPYTVMIDYAHTPDSLENILTTVKGFVKGRLISVFGCGGDRDRSKRPLMGEISGRIADLTIITSDNPRTEVPSQIMNDIELGIKKTQGKYIMIEDRTEAIRYAMKHAKKDDIIVLSGKGHETYQIFKDKTIHYDEREIVENILEEKEG
jgi:UDP-N-acetylmuramoyl-L-alanyl-D-glutamate--2,6-diaminopimelate ligase